MPANVDSCITAALTAEVHWRIETGAALSKPLSQLFHYFAYMDPQNLPPGKHVTTVSEAHFTA